MKKRLLYLSLIFTVALCILPLSINASSLHKGTPKILRGYWMAKQKHEKPLNDVFKIVYGRVMISNSNINAGLLCSNKKSKFPSNVFSAGGMDPVSYEKINSHLYKINGKNYKTTQAGKWGYISIKNNKISVNLDKGIKLYNLRRVSKSTYNKYWDKK
ncbi:hypothetical protein M2S00_07245 [Apilactobacillus sp. TMW 2.2459]|uniref:hypothetical protein n=1 Tax=Apilactobacillus xinyiensis TaxID=2841032 RepID=UPI00200EE951|nr:hypothetical protein [Apilactobacillus xinyiensis]MCL0312901.1 hypothetical protein [Apilactobacillus xinyiensis]